MLDIKLFRENPQLIKDNLIKKFQEHKIEWVDEIVELDLKVRELKKSIDDLRAQKNRYSKEIGALMAKKDIDAANKAKNEVVEIGKTIDNQEKEIEPIQEKIKSLIMNIPNIIDDSVPVGKDDSQNVELFKVGEAKKPDFEIPHHIEIMESLLGVDLDSARKTSGAGFYYLMGDVARLHSSILSYARDFMVNNGFTYVIPPFMIHKNVVEGVMSFEEMENMMYKIEGEDLYLIGTSEHSMIGKYIDTIIKADTLPHMLTSYSPCFRKEVGAHGIEERGVYRIHQFEKQEMVVLCHPSQSMDFFNKMYKLSLELFESLLIPVRVIECCSGDLADLKVKSVDIEAYSPRQDKYFEVCSCSNLGDAQSRRLMIRVDDNGEKYYPHTLNNTVVAPPRMLIAYLENNLMADGSIKIAPALQPYMGGQKAISRKK